MSGFAELAAASNFSFLRASSHPEEMVREAKALGFDGLGIADRNTLAGIVRAHACAKTEGLRLGIGARLEFSDDTPDILAFPTDRAAYGRLAQLLTLGNRRAAKGECDLRFEDWLAHAAGMQAIVAPVLAPGALPDQRLAECLRAAKAACGGRIWLAARQVFDGEDKRRLRLLAELAAAKGARLIATTEPLHHIPARRPLLDVLTCVREKTTLADAGRRLAPNAERHLKAPAEMARLYAAAPEAVAETRRFLAGLHFSLDELSHHYPTEMMADHADPHSALAALTWAGAARRYPAGIPEKVRESLDRELDIVAQLKFAPYFLTVADIVRFAREERGILCQGRGSAANSAICYCLGVTSVDPEASTLLFDRFISTERNEPPDIDVDFEHERREEVIQYVYEKYGRNRAALAGSLICYRRKSALRDVGKVFGFSEDCIAALAKAGHHWQGGMASEPPPGLDMNDPALRACLALCEELRGFPRHLSQHVGGFVITADRLDTMAVIQNAAMADRTVIEWDKDDLRELNILKVDILALGMLTALRKAFAMIDEFYPDSTERGAEKGAEQGAEKGAARGAEPGAARGAERGTKLSLDTLPREDPRVYAMLQSADSVGVFQVESRAQMSMLPRLQPECFYDLVIEVAIVRPGPIQGGMVHPYLRRRQGLEPVSYPSKALEAVLSRTLGVPLFQEQAMQIAIVAAGFTPPEADRLRRAMATFRRVGTIGLLKEKFINGMIANGYDAEFAQSCFAQVEGFGEYGFPESHAASFALLVYASSWVKCHYPDVFAAALLNSQPMGFYAPAQIVRDAAEHGVEIRAPDINHSDWDSSLEPGPAAATRLHPRFRCMAGDIRSTRALRLGFRQIDGVREADMRQIIARRGRGYDSVRDLWLRGGVSIAAIERLADADAFRSLGLDRRMALWAARGLNRVGGQEDAPLLRRVPDSRPSHDECSDEGSDECNEDTDTGSRRREPDYPLPPLTIGEQVIADYRHLSLTLKAHPLALLRPRLAARGIIPAGALARIRDGARVRVAGLVLVRQRPGTASGVIFMTLEDETHIANLVIWPKIFERFRAETLGAQLCGVEGRVQSQNGVVHIIAERLHDFSMILAELMDSGSAGNPVPRKEPPGAAPGAAPGSGAPQFPNALAEIGTHPRQIRHTLRVPDTPVPLPDSIPVPDFLPSSRDFH